MKLTTSIMNDFGSSNVAKVLAYYLITSNARYFGDNVALIALVFGVAIAVGLYCKQVSDKGKSWPDGLIMSCIGLIAGVIL